MENQENFKILIIGAGVKIIYKDFKNIEEK
jgi:hypothetical protein